MIKAVVAVLAALALVASPATSDQKEKVVQVTATLSDFSFAGDRSVRYMTLWKHSRSAAPIGQAWEFCFPLGIRHSYVCSVYFQLPGGKLEASGVTHRAIGFFAPVIGASGAYAGLDGTLELRRDLAGSDDYLLRWELK